MSKTIKFAGVLAVAAAALQLAAGLAQANPAAQRVPTVDEATVSASRIADGPSVRVFHGDLDLSAPAGIKTLQGRIKAAVNRVCPRSADSRMLQLKRNESKCRDAAWAGAMAQVDAVISQAQLATR